MSKGLFVLLVLGGLVAAMFLVPRDEVPLSADTQIQVNSPVAITDTQPQIVYVTVPASPLPTYTPQPTREPLPTYTPYPTPAVIVEYREAPIFCYGWCGQVVLGLFALALIPIALVAASVVKYYLDVRAEETEAIAQVRIAEANKDRPINPQPRDRIVTVNTRPPVDDPPDTVRLGDLVVDKHRLTDFVIRSRTQDIGLAIGQWKKEGWAQEDLEKLLDIMTEAGLITERKNGVACQYIGDPEPARILRELGKYGS